ncbi:MAG: hypothetical protein AAGB29_11275 [Planctomycetota bacterium]
MASSTAPSKPFPLFKSIAVLIAAVAGLAILGILAMRFARLDLALQIECAVAAAGCAGAGVIGLIAVKMGQRMPGPQGIVTGFLAGTTLRLFLSAAVAGLAFMAFEKQRVLLWFGLWYLVVLVIEVNAVTSYLIAQALSDRDKTDWHAPSDGDEPAEDEANPGPS